MVEAERRYVRADDIVTRRVAGELIVLRGGPALNPGGSDDLYVLGGSGEELWELLASERSPDELVGFLTTTYAVSEHEARADVARFVDDLVAAGALRTVSQ